ncbi:MAG: hypothetical protein GC136_07825 [Alphaproteobacteria bacterium]|nr:hypothetical protein [Alphaproteobacteria bacterium]
MSLDDSASRRYFSAATKGKQVSTEDERAVIDAAVSMLGDVAHLLRSSLDNVRNPLKDSFGTPQSAEPVDISADAKSRIWFLLVNIDRGEGNRVGYRKLTIALDQPNSTLKCNWDYIFDDEIPAGTDVHGKKNYPLDQAGIEEIRLDALAYFSTLPEVSLQAVARPQRELVH